jgi:hypothetical protein
VERRRDARGRAQFRRIIGYQHLATLAVAIERELVLPLTTEEVVTLVNA